MCRYHQAACWQIFANILSLKSNAAGRDDIFAHELPQLAMKISPTLLMTRWKISASWLRIKLPNWSATICIDLMPLKRGIIFSPQIQWRVIYMYIYAPLKINTYTYIYYTPLKINVCIKSYFIHIKKYDQYMGTANELAPPILSFDPINNCKKKLSFIFVWHLHFQLAFLSTELYINILHSFKSSRFFWCSALMSLKHGTCEGNSFDLMKRFVCSRLIFCVQ